MSIVTLDSENTLKLLVNVLREKYLLSLMPH